MAAKDKKTATKKTTSQTKVTRIVATDTKKTAKEKPALKSSPKLATKTNKTSPLGRLGTPFFALGRYFKGAWYELRQVRWPNRKATWSLTGAMLIFTAFFVVLILVLDALFKYLFQLILG